MLLQTLFEKDNEFNTNEVKRARVLLTALQSFEVERARVLQYFAMMHTENLLVINDYFKLGESQ